MAGVGLSGLSPGGSGGRSRRVREAMEVSNSPVLELESLSKKDENSSVKYYKYAVRRYITFVYF